MSWASWRQSATSRGRKSGGASAGKQTRSGKGRGGESGVARESGERVRMRRWSMKLAMVGTGQMFDLQ